MSNRSNALADRLERGARALAEFAAGLTAAEWSMKVEGERKVGVIVHHVASVYPLEIQLARTVAAGKPIEQVTWAVIHALNARHALENDAVTQEATLELLAQNSAAAAAAIRAFGDAELDRAAPVSLNEDAPLTCQFMLEDHAVRHSYHHLARIRGAVQRLRSAA
jgi:DinB family protein